ncbi:hypothetical protein DIPPA_30165 [Diplonema papillatum]|nr:hypothetical protein DIPPA_30165 [Diplonema papillatum]
MRMLAPRDMGPPLVAVEASVPRLGPSQPCVYSIMCPFLKERAHLDRFSHPCIRYFHTGHCDLAHEPAHASYYSHTERVGYPMHPADDLHTNRSLTSEQVQQEQSNDIPAEHIGKAYYDALRARDANTLLSLHNANSVVIVDQGSPELNREYVGKHNIQRYYAWLVDKLKWPVVIDSFSVTEPGRRFKATWRSPANGFKLVKELFTVEGGAVSRIKVVLSYSAPEPAPVRPAAAKRAPPEPFSADTRLRGKPLTPASLREKNLERARGRLDYGLPKSTDVDEAICSRAACPRPPSPPRNQREEAQAPAEEAPITPLRISRIARPAAAKRAPPEPFSADARLRGKPLTPASLREKNLERARGRLDYGLPKSTDVDEGICSRAACPRLPSPPRNQREEAQAPAEEAPIAPLRISSSRRSPRPRPKILNWR